jgi:hypothetical protein
LEGKIIQEMGDEEKEENPVVIEMEWVDSIEWGCH